MARLTRSKKIQVAEDQTAHTTLTETLEHPPALAVLPMEPNALPAHNDDSDTQVKELKAAYRAALGVGKKGGKKGKGKNKGKKALPETEEALDGSNSTLAARDSEDGAQNSVPDTPQQLLQNQQDDDVNERQSGQAVAPSRSTRQQSAKAQAAKEKAVAEAIVAETDLTEDTKGSETPSDDKDNERHGESNNTADLIESMASSRTLDPDTDTDTMNSRATEDRNTLPGDEPMGKQGEIAHLTRSPVKTLEEVEQVYGSEGPGTPLRNAGEDSFVEQITSRSPAKPISRIEDSVEALDQLEEALEALDQAALAETKFPTNKERQNTHSETPFDKSVLNSNPKTDRKQMTAKALKSKPGYKSMRMNPTAPKQAPVRKRASSMTFKPTTANTTKSAEEKPKSQQPMRAPVKRPVSLLPPREPLKSTKQPTRSTFELPGEAVARRLKEQREARLALREANESTVQPARVCSGPKIKSTKPLTASTFRLPGEEISQRKREAHDARLKAQEEEERKRREFKAKPVRKASINMLPRDTVASRARQSKIGLENIENDNLTISKRISNVGAHRPSILELDKFVANSSAPRAPAPAPGRKPSPAVAGFSGLSMSGRAMQRTVSTTDVQVQRQRAKEIYNRDAKATEDIEREKREREVAAKRAREEAAERGRQASRDWAEKQAAKKLAQADKGMSAGYGPGGQLGLTS